MDRLLSSAQNNSVAFLPIYYVLCLAPHSYAISLSTRKNPNGVLGGFDNRNPRSGTLKQHLQRSLDARTYARYERAEAAHYNSLENFPLVAAAVLAGNLARLDPGELNTYCAGIGALRLAHQVVYVSTESNRYTWMRSTAWMAGLAWSLRMLWKAGKALA